MPVPEKINFGPILTPNMAPNAPQRSKISKLFDKFGNRVEIQKKEYKHAYF